MISSNKSYEELLSEMETLQSQLDEANETIEAIRTGQIDALIVQGDNGNQIYTLKSADQTYRVFIEKMTEGAVTLNKDGIILYSNSKFASMVQSSLSQVIGLPFQQFITSEYHAHFQQVLQSAWHEDTKGEVLLSGKENQIPVQLSLATLDLDEGFALSIILTDLTAQKKTQSQLAYNNAQLEQMNYALELSNHDLQQFASVASHDLQEPLRKILIFSQLLKDKQPGSDPGHSPAYIDKIIESAKRMRTLIIDILDYSRLSEKSNKFERIELNQVLDEVLNDYEVSIKDKKAIISVGDLPVLQANKGQMRQVFQNLISNALKFAKEEESPRILIKANRISGRSFDAAMQQDGPYFKISITDNGIGFDQQYLANIFALFERLNPKDRYEGTGIGLAITKKIIEKHQGLITAVSAEGLGSEFIIILPELQLGA